MRDERSIAASVKRWAAQRRDELVQELCEMIRIPSVAQPGQDGYVLGRGCHDAAQRLITLGKHFGFEVEDHDGMCVSIILRSSGQKQELGILGHLDVVPAGEGWHFDPFDPVLQRGHVIGRGSSDNKGPVMMALFAMRCMRDLGLQLRSSVRLIAGLCEETDMQDVRHYLSQRHPPAFTLNCDGAWPLCMGEKGILTAQLAVMLQDGNVLHMQGGEAINSIPARAQATLMYADDPPSLPRNVRIKRNENVMHLHAQGVSAHCCAPAQGQNAIRLLLQAVQPLVAGDTACKLAALLKCIADDRGEGAGIAHEDSLSATTCVPVLLETRGCEVLLTINARTALTQREADVRAALCKRCAKLGVEVKNIRFSPPRCTPPDDPIVKLLLDTCHTFLRRKDKPYLSGGGTYSRLFPSSIPFGPLQLSQKGPFGRMHGPDEAVNIEELLQAMQVYVVALCRLDAYF